MRWRARYSDLETLESGPGWSRSTEEIDRARLDRFEVYATDTAVSPSISVAITPGLVVMARQRTFVSTGGSQRIALVAVESRGRELLALWELPEGGVPVMHDSYGGPGLWPPEPNAREVA